MMNLVAMEMTHAVIAYVINVTNITVVLLFVVTVHVFRRAFVRTIGIIAVFRFYPLVFCASVLEPYLYLK